jgi:hypothetical protein
MASNNNVPQIYSWVIQDVVEKMGRKFAELGLDENVLTDLRQVLAANVDMGGENPTIRCRTVCKCITTSSEWISSICQSQFPRLIYAVSHRRKLSISTGNGIQWNARIFSTASTE